MGGSWLGRVRGKGRRGAFYGCYVRRSRMRSWTGKVEGGEGVEEALDVHVVDGVKFYQVVRTCRK